MTSYVLLFTLPYMLLYMATLLLCYKLRSAAPKPALVAGIATGALLLKSLLSLLFMVLLVGGISTSGFSTFILDAIIFIMRAIGWLAPVIYLFAAFAWRNSDDDPQYKYPAICCAVYILLIVLTIITAKHFFGHTQTETLKPDLMVILLNITFTAVNFFGFMVLMIGIFNWRDFDLKQELLNPPESVKNLKGERKGSGMFYPSDYWGFVTGVAVLGGLIIIPSIWGGFNHMSYGRSLFPSLLSCGIFIFAHDRQGNFSLQKFIVGMVIVIMSILRAVAQSKGGTQQPFFLAGGILGFVIMYACGWLGIFFRRLTRRFAGI